MRVLLLLLLVAAGLVEAQNDLIDFGNGNPANRVMKDDISVLGNDWTQELYSPPVVDFTDGSIPTTTRDHPYEMTMQQGRIWYGLYNPQTGERMNQTFYGYAKPGEGPTFPGPTIIVNSGQQVFIRFTNLLPSTPHIFGIDRTVMCSTVSNDNVLCRSQNGSDTRTTVHLHGGHSIPESDGHPRSWFTNTNGAVPGDYGSHFPAGTYGNTYQYDNTQPATTLFYHDHAEGITRLNVGAGLVGFYFIKDAHRTAKNLPEEIPVAITDRNFVYERDAGNNVVGAEVWYPTQITDPDGTPCPAGCLTPESPGQFTLVNGMYRPVKHVEAKPYLLRVLNGADSRLMDIYLTASDEVGMVDGGPVTLPVTVVGTDQGLKRKPSQVSYVEMGPGERYEFVVDFSQLDWAPGQTEQVWYLADNRNDGLNNGPLLRFVVASPGAVPKPAPWTGWDEPTDAVDWLLAEVPTAKVRQVFMTEKAQLTATGCLRPQPILANRGPGGSIQGNAFHMPPTEILQVNVTEVWELINLSPDSHPIHVHQVQFKILSRNWYSAGYQLRQSTTEPLRIAAGTVRPARPQEDGPKDIAFINPSEIVRIVLKPDLVGEYVWHCHILSHEDNTMMRPLIITP